MQIGTRVKALRLDAVSGATVLEPGVVMGVSNTEPYVVVEFSDGTRERKLRDYVEKVHSCCGNIVCFCEKVSA